MRLPMHAWGLDHSIVFYKHNLGEASSTAGTMCKATSATADEDTQQTGIHIEMCGCVACCCCVALQQQPG